MKKNFSIFSFLALLLLVTSQIVWVYQLAERDRSRFKRELTTLLNDITKHQATEQTYELFNIHSELPVITIEAIKEDSIPDNARVYGKYDNESYETNTSLSKFIEAAMTEMLFVKSSLNLKAMDSLFRENFPHTTELSNYIFKIVKADEAIDSLIFNKNNTQQLNDTTVGVFVNIALGTSGTYQFVSHFVFRPSAMTRRLMPPVWLSGIAVIVVALILFILLLRMKRQMIRLQLQEKRTRGIVHDLKSPLSYIYSLLGLFEMGEKDSQKREQLTKGKSRVKHLSENIERMLLEDKLEDKNEKVLIRNAYDIKMQCSKIVDDLRTTYTSKFISVTFAIEPDANIINVDTFYFNSCLRNLLDNAIKYSGDAPVITIYAKKQKQKICIAIKDNGMGISKKEQRKVFEQFFRSKEHTDVEGHGIGLSFVQQVVNSHGGNIILNSILGVGSTFTIHLPEKSRV